MATQAATQAGASEIAVDNGASRAAIMRALASRALDASRRSSHSEQARFRPGDSLRLRAADRSAAAESLSGAHRLGAALDGVQETIGRLRSLVHSLESQTDGAPADSVQRAQSQIDAMVAGLERVASESRELGATLLAGGSADNDNFTVVNVSPAFESLRVARADVAPGEQLDVELRVFASAQNAGKYLSFGGATLDLSSIGFFTFEIGGVNGTRLLSFASGTTVSAIKESISALGRDIGLSATLGANGTGVFVHSRDVGAHARVSLRILDDGGIRDQIVHSASATAQRPDGFVGVYDLKRDDALSVSPQAFVAFSAAVDSDRALVDQGRDVAAQITIDGGAHALRASGAAVWLDSDELRFTGELRLGPGSASAPVTAQTTGVFNGFTVVGLASPEPDDTDIDTQDEKEERQREREERTINEDAPPTSIATEAERIATAFQQASIDFGLRQPLDAAGALAQRARQAQVQALQAVAADGPRSGSDAEVASVGVRRAALASPAGASALSDALEATRVLSLLGGGSIGGA